MNREKTARQNWNQRILDRWREVDNAGEENRGVAVKGIELKKSSWAFW